MDIALVIECVLYGVYMLLFMVALTVLIPKPKTIANVCMLVVTSVMFGIVSLRIVLHIYLEDVATLSYRTVIYLILERYLPTVNFVLGDAIVAWRAWVIWDCSYRIVVIPVLLLAVTTAIVTAELVSGVRFAASLAWEEGLGYSFETDLRIAVALTLGTNLIVTGLIGYRTWIRHRTVTPRQVRVGHDRIQALLILLIESGALYCCIWIAYLSAAWKYGDLENPSLAFEIFDSALPQLVGIYPTLIIVLCSLQRSYHDTAMTSDCANLPMAPPQYSPEHYTHSRAEDPFVPSKDSDTPESRPVSVGSAMIFYVAPSRSENPPSYIDLCASNVDLAPASVVRSPYHPNPLRRRSDSSSPADDSSVPELDYLDTDSV
ncbi:hypothetical protein BV25DRAFT_1915153 [Artomyces pyxidatus]|uniref:Uncharacterized protein n=1 Tax=Artomyces pyxidatus TaxID=48021 RepID=A0ACB8T558_9AGAM|nr:hypothetical protein BV25DRAFT_1915153 [Artomyces pyxidatus]